MIPASLLSAARCSRPASALLNWFRTGKVDSVGCGGGLGQQVDTGHRKSLRMRVFRNVHGPFNAFGNLSEYAVYRRLN